MLAAQVIKSLDWNRAGVQECLIYLAKWAELILPGAAAFF